MSLLTFIRREEDVRHFAHLSEYCRDIDFSMIARSKTMNARQALQSLVTRKSFIVSRDWHPHMQAKVIEQLGLKPDLVYVDHLQMFQYVPDPAPCPVVLDEHNVEWRIIERFASAGTPPMQRLFASLECPRLRSYELRASHRADLVLTVTPEDRQLLVSHGVAADKIVPLPVGVDTQYFHPVYSAPEDTKVLTFGTMSWPPNADAVRYYASSIHPRVRQRVPGARLVVVGANPPPDVQALADRDASIEVTGFVDDIRAASEGTAAFVVPLRIGSGMRVKILDAMAMGLPVVTTSVGCEGISLRHGEHALVVDDPAEFADAVAHLVLNHDERMRFGSAGRRLVENIYSWPPILQRLDLALSRIPQEDARRGGL